MKTDQKYTERELKHPNCAFKNLIATSGTQDVFHEEKTLSAGTTYRRRVVRGQAARLKLTPLCFKSFHLRNPIRSHVHLDPRLLINQISFRITRFWLMMRIVVKLLSAFLLTIVGVKTQTPPPATATASGIYWHICNAMDSTR